MELLDSNHISLLDSQIFFFYEPYNWAYFLVDKYPPSFQLYKQHYKEDLKDTILQLQSIKIQLK